MIRTINSDNWHITYDKKPPGLRAIIMPGDTPNMLCRTRFQPDSFAENCRFRAIKNKNILAILQIEYSRNSSIHVYGAGRGVLVHYSFGVTYIGFPFCAIPIISWCFNGINRCSKGLTNFSVVVAYV